MAATTNETPQPDVLDKTIKFLQKREGIDKALKLIRYMSRLLAALSPADSEVRKRFESLQSSVGTSRKAFRLGKFLQDVNSLRKSDSTGCTYLLEAVAYVGEGVYYFIEQIVWLMKTGALSKSQEKELAKLSAWSEFLGYVANITLSVMKLKEINRRYMELSVRMDKLRKEEGQLDMRMEIERRMLMAAKHLKTAAIVQDTADSMMAINDIRGGNDPVISHPVFLALAGLVSGAISTRKNWNS